MQRPKPVPAEFLLLGAPVAARTAPAFDRRHRAGEPLDGEELDRRSRARRRRQPERAAQCILDEARFPPGFGFTGRDLDDVLPAGHPLHDGGLVALPVDDLDDASSFGVGVAARSHGLGRVVERGDPPMADRAKRQPVVWDVEERQQVGGVRRLARALARQCQRVDSEVEAFVVDADDADDDARTRPVGGDKTFGERERDVADGSDGTTIHWGDLPLTVMSEGVWSSTPRHRRAVLGRKVARRCDRNDFGAVRAFLPRPWIPRARWQGARHTG